MTSIVKTRLVKVGNGQGIQLPKAVLAQVGLIGDAQVEVGADHLIVRPAHRPRLGWEEEFRRMAALGDDALLDGDAAELVAE